MMKLYRCARSGGHVAWEGHVTSSSVNKFHVHTNYSCQQFMILPVSVFGVLVLAAAALSSSSVVDL